MKRLFLFSLLLLLAVGAFANTYTIGAGTSSTSYSPFYGLYDYGWNKIIYTAAEINTAGLTGAQDIYGFGFYAFNTPANHVLLNQKVYVRQTTLAAYGTATDETGTAYPASAGFTQVYDADVVYNGIGWYYLMFSAPFAWDGTSNLEILYENWDGDYYTGYTTHSYTTTSTNYRTVYKYADTTFPTTVGTRSYNRPNFRLVTQTLDPAPTATLASPADGITSFLDASLVWNNSQGMASSYDVYFGTAANPPFLTNIADMIYTPTLDGGTTYYWKIIPRNATGAAPEGTIRSFTTVGTNQLAESFENATFPPVGWTNPGAFTRSTTTPFHLTAGAYKSTAAPAMLYTPMMELTGTSQLNFMARASATTGIGRIQIKYSADGSVWNPIGDVIAMPTNTTWNNYVVDLSSLAGDNYMLGFETYSSSTTSAAIYIDYVYGPDYAALTPDPATAVYPLEGGYAFMDGILSWSAAGTGGVPTSYDVYFGTSATPPFIANQTGTTYTPTLAASTTYYWQIVPRNDTGSADNSPVWSFQTPGANQLAESFEVATPFLPVGWNNPGTWSGTTTSPFHGARVAYKSASTTPAILSTPILAINASSVLDFYYRTAATTGVGMLNIKYSPDRVTWTQIGATIPMPTTTTWNHAVVALGAIPAGNYFLAFEVSTSSSTASIYIDHVFGPDLAAVAPGPVALTAPADLAADVALFPTFTWTAPSAGGVPSGYRLYVGTTNPPTSLVSDQTVLTYTYTTPLTYSTVYYWKVEAYNGTGSSTGDVIRSFTTMADPTITVLPWGEDFGTTGTTFPPTNWTRWSGALADPSTLTSGSTIWGQDNWLNDTTVTPVNWSARMNIYSTARQHWIITPPIQLPGAGYQLEFDIALTDYANSNPISSDVNGTTGVDDKFIVLIGNGGTWTPANVVRQWDNAGSSFVYNDIPHTGLRVILPLDTYTGIKYIAFYGESTISNADNDFFVDNVMVRQTPAGAPEHVTLNSPANGATGVYPENTTLSWTASMGGGTPAYYEVFVGEFPIDPSSDYYGEYFYESSTPNLNLSAQGDIALDYDTHWYWAVLPYNSEGNAPDPMSTNFMVWDFTIISDPAIASLPYAEYFDTATPPALPYGWTSVVNATTTAAYVNTYSSTTYAVSAPNSVRLFNSTDAAANVMLITPEINVPINTIKAKFFARGSTAGQVLLVGTVDTATNTFTQLGSIATTTTQVEYQVSFATYAGTDTHIAFKHGLGATSRTIYMDNVQLLELLPVDLAATSLTGQAILVAGTSYDYVVNVYNEGTATVSTYNINLKRDGDIMLASQAVTTPITPGTTAQITVSWTPPIGGVFNIYGEVIATGDGNASNDETPLKEVYVLDNTMTVIPVGDDATTTSSTMLPADMYYRNSVTEELYFTDEMHMQSGSITALVYKNNFLNDRPDKAIKIWMAHTTVTDLSGGWLPSVNYSLVFDGIVDFPAGVNNIVIPLQTPFAFTGGTLAIRVNRVFDSGTLSSSDKFFYTTNPAHTIRSRYLRSDTVTYDPLAPSAAGTTLGYFPNTTFIVQNAVMQTAAILSGHVYETGGVIPVVGATVTLTDERYTTTTDAEGFYSFTFWEPHTVTAVASKATYYSQTVTGLNLTMGNTLTQNFILGAMPRVTVSGIVNTNDVPGGIEGAAINLNGYEIHNVISGVNGAFSIPNVLGSNVGQAYTITITKAGYVGYSAPVSVLETNLNLGTITLNEHLWTAYDLVASLEGNSARLVWDPATEPSYFLDDFEVDNGGWVGSGYGDWEWSDAYNVANFVYTYTAANVVAPPTAHTGDGMWGTKMLTNYSNSGAFSYLTKTVDLAGFTAPQLRFWSWENTYGNWDYCQVAINGTLVWGPSWQYTGTTWTERVIDLSAYTNQTVQVQFQFYATTSVNYAGWYVDDIYIGSASSVPVASLGMRNIDRSLLNYSLYRFLAADQANPANWTTLSTTLMDTTYLDLGFASVPNGDYKWAVKANYTGSLQSDAIVSNTLTQLAISTPVGVTATVVGATVQLGWTAVAGANYYVIYAADDPYGAYGIAGYSATNSYSIATPVAYKFYKVAAATGVMPTAAPAKSLK